MLCFCVSVFRKIVFTDMYKSLSIHKIIKNKKMATFNKTLYLVTDLPSAPGLIEFSTKSRTRVRKIKIKIKTNRVRAKALDKKAIDRQTRQELREWRPKILSRIVQYEN